MREIKFRAWDKEGGEMITDGVAFEMIHLALPPPEESYEHEGVMTPCPETYKRFDIMQYTGLKDKGGKEIYEGDIVKCHSWDWWDGVVTWQPEGSMGWCIEPLTENSHRGRYGMNYSYEFEVIGNVHEHPELMRKEK